MAIWRKSQDGSLISVSFGYTLQLVGQQYAKASHATVIMCLEAPVAALGGYIILGEIMTLRMIAGGLLMLMGVMISQKASK